MKANDMIREALARIGVSARTVSGRMGRNPNYLSSVLYKDSDVRADNLAEIVESMGGRLVARSRASGEEIIITAHEDELLG